MGIQMLLAVLATQPVATVGICSTHTHTHTPLQVPHFPQTVFSFQLTLRRHSLLTPLPLTTSILGLLSDLSQSEMCRFSTSFLNLCASFLPLLQTGDFLRAGAVASSGAQRIPEVRDCISLRGGAPRRGLSKARLSPSFLLWAELYPPKIHMSKS